MVEEPAPANPGSLETRSAALAYGEEIVVAGLDFAVPVGRFTALLGPNGCGKSTVLKALAGFLRPRGGAVLLDGEDIAHLPSKQVARKIGVLGQSSAALEGLTVQDLVRQGRYPHRSLFGRWTAEDSAAVEQALSLTGVAALRDRMLDTLSGGQRQRAWIAMTLAQQSGVLLLDEPTTYLDLAHQIEVLGLMRRLVDSGGATVVAVLHDLNQAARYADHVVLMRDGALRLSGSPRQALTAESVRDVFGVEAVFVSDPESGAPFCIPKLRQPGDEEA